MLEPVAIRKAKVEIAEGRLWKARDRLSGSLAHRPADQTLLELLGEVYFRMGDYPAAGRFWFLTARKGPEVDVAMAALEERYPNRQSLGLAIPVRAPIEAFPEEVQTRLVKDRLSHYLNPQARMQYPKGHKGPWLRMGSQDPLAASRAGRFGNALGTALLRVIGVGCWLVGAYTVIRVSEGFVLVPIAVVIATIVVALRIDSLGRRRRLARLQERQSHTAEPPSES
ncbi:MAG TPA: DUF6584 family protein [Actinomycetota bacterium]|nr:DUF6584 family protein [Actinomycetota bacterium]